MSIKNFFNHLFDQEKEESPLDLTEVKALNSVNLKLITLYAEEKIPLGVSKFGGKPHFPQEFSWPVFRGKSSYNETIKNWPLAFLAQINLEEVASYDLDHRLPEKGMLYFFYELETLTSGVSPKDKGAAKVFYYDGDLSLLREREFPEDLCYAFQLPEMKLQFSSRENLPSPVELGAPPIGEYVDFLTNKGYVIPDESVKLLGYADNIQGDMLLKCALVTDGYQCAEPFNAEIPQMPLFEEKKKQWHLLFQMDSIHRTGFDLMFGDCGKLYFYIKEDDLVRKRFDEVWAFVQCYSC